MLPEPQDGKQGMLLCRGVAQSEGEFTKSLEPKQSQTHRLKTFPYRPTVGDTQVQSVVLSHVPKDKHKKLLKWWNCSFLCDSRAEKSRGGDAWVGKWRIQERQ